ncbi:MAG: hypothetical protein IKP66_00895 [Lachnospiraceae bacterium]|nr:hypothetical protein [Lachnospiraceae bacterium]
MKKFLKNNKYILGFLVVSLIYSILFVVKTDKETISSMLYAVALSYIAAFVFYLLQIYYPEKKKVEIINKIIKSRVKNVVVKIKGLYDEMFKLYIPEYSDNINVDLYMKNLLQFKFDDRTSVCNIRRVDNLRSIKQSSYMTLREMTQEMIFVLKENIDFLYKTFPNYLPTELIRVFEKMNDSLYLHAMTFNMQTLLPCDFTECEPNLFEDFWNMYKELKACCDKI